MSKLFIRMTLLMLLLITISACHAPKAASQDLIVTTIYPYQILVQQLVGNNIDVKCLIPPNASPHTWSPKPSDMQNLESAKLIVSNGFGLETNLSPVFEKYRDKHVELGKLLDLNTLPKAEVHAEAEHEEHEHHHGAYDPHIWTSPENLVNITNILSTELIKRFPNYTDVINHNKMTVIQELMAADVKIMTERAQFDKPAIVTYHNSYFYFTKRYDINYIGFVQASPGQEPTPRELSELGNRIKTANVKSVFIEPQMNPKSAEILAREFGLKLLTIDPLGSTMQVNTISEYILKSWDILKSGL